MKLLMLALCALLTTIVHGQHVIRIYLDENMPVTTIINEGKVFTTNLRLKNYRKARQLTLKFENIGASRKHSLVVSNDADSTLMTIPEKATEYNTFKIDVVKLRSVISRFKNLKVYYLEEPRNPLMRIRSQSSQLMNIHFN